MDNNESKSYNREVRQDSFTDADNNIHTNVTRTSETVENDPNTYEEGYVSGRIQEQNYQRKDLAARDSNNANSGLILGILLATFATLAGGAIWYFNQYREAENPTPTIIQAPVTTTEPKPTEPEAAQPPQNNTTTVIEKTKEVAVPVEVPVPVPQQQAPAPAPAPKQPDININVPPQGGATESNSTPQKTTPKQPQSSNDGSNNSSEQPQKQPDSTNSTSTVSPPNVLGSDSTDKPQ